MSRKPLPTAQTVKLLVGAGQATPSPPVGPALGSKGVKSMDFCKEFNARTSAFVPGTPIPARVHIRADRSFSFELRTPPTSALLLSAAGVAPEKTGGRRKGAGRAGAAGQAAAESATGAAMAAAVVGNAGRREVGSPVGLKAVWEIAKIKCGEERLRGLGMEAMVKSVVGQARSVGVKIVP